MSAPGKHIHKLDGFEQKTFITSRKLTYNYYTHNTRGETKKPTLLFIHGFPDNAEEWAPIMPQFRALGYPLILVDLIGMDGSSKPTDPALFAGRYVAEDLGELVRAEGVTQLIPIGHDWGSFYAGRVYNYNPHLCVGLVNMSNIYTPPTKDRFNWEENNRQTAEKFGNAQYAYWELFCAPDAPQTLHDNIEVFWSIMHGQRPMEDLWCHYGRMRDFIQKGQPDPLREYAKDPALKDSWIARMKRDGFESPLNYYHAFKENHHWAADVDMPVENMKVKVPALFVGSTGDHVCRLEHNANPIERGLLRDLTIKEIEAPHWMLYSNPDEVADILATWLKARF